MTDERHSAKVIKGILKNPARKLLIKGDYKDD